MTAAPAPPNRHEQISALAGGDAFRRRSALEALGRLPKDAETAALVLASLHDPSGYVVRTAAGIARRWGLADAAPRLREVAGDPDPLTRRISLEALRDLGSEADVELLMKVLSRDANRDVRNAAAWALAAVAGPSTWRRSFELLVAGDVPRHRQLACELVREFGDAADRETLRPLLSDHDGHVRKAAAQVLAEGEP